jgi:hypothetical protein
MFNPKRFLGLHYLLLLLVGCKATPANLLDGLTQKRPDAGEVAKGLPPDMREEIAKCLPSDVQLDTVAEWRFDGDWQKITVEQKLAKLGAYAGKDGKLHDPSGREIRFCYSNPGWGNPPARYWEIKEDEEEARRWKEFQDKYTVISITSGLSHK